MSVAARPNDPPTFQWNRWPETDRFLHEKVAAGLVANAFARRLADRMEAETSTLFKDWLDHLVLTSGSETTTEELLRLGYEPTDVSYPSGTVFAHSGGLFPRVILKAGTQEFVEELALKVESIADFSEVHDLGLSIAGPPLASYRVARIPGGETSLAVVERRGDLGFDPDRDGPSALDVLQAREIWQTRRRKFPEDSQGFDTADTALERMIALVGEGMACHLVFEVERDYWQSRNRAARVQKERQDRLGLGWANHDHHTFRSSRKSFPRLIGLFERLGFELREHFHAGQHAGWGAQVLEHRVSGIVIFADLDLAPDEITQDFSHNPLPDLPRPNTVGLWVGLHGESILEAGMHHLEAQFSFDDLRDDLQAEAGIETMKPFSNFPFLLQAFTAGERWPVAKDRADRLLAAGWIDADQHARFVAEGAIGSHLENLQRTEGYKGFNQQAVSAIIAETDPRLH